MDAALADGIGFFCVLLHGSNGVDRLRTCLDQSCQDLACLDVSVRTHHRELIPKTRARRSVVAISRKGRHVELKNNTILITGGSSGIGLESARRLSKENRILICGRSRERLETAKLALPNVDIFQCDLSDEGACRALAEWVVANHPKCNVLINNAAVHHVGDFMSRDDRLGQARMEVNINLMAPLVTPPSIKAVAKRCSSRARVLGASVRLVRFECNFRGGWAFSGIHQDSVMAQAYTNTWIRTAVDDETYFPGTLRLVYMLLAANRFPKGCM